MVRSSLKTIINILAFLLIILYAASFAFADSYDYIMKWALDFLPALKQGQIMHYYEISHADYNILIMLIFAAWMIPFDLVMETLGLGYNVIIYTMWYKLILVLFLMLSVHSFGKLLRKFEISEDKIWLGKLLYIISPMTLMGNIGWGQIDIIPMLFVIIAMGMCLDKKYIRMCILFAFACAFKYHVFLLAVPLILLLEKRIWALVRNLIICFSIPVIVEILSRFDPYYLFYKNSENTQYLGGVLAANFNHQGMYIACFLFLCMACYCIKINADNSYLLVVMPAASFFLFMFFVNWHAQWAIYILPFIIMLLMQLGDMCISMLLNLGIGIGHLCYQIVLWEKNGDNYMTEHGIFQLLLNRTEGYQGIPLAQFLGSQTWIGQTIIIPCLAFVILLFIYEKYKGKVILADKNTGTTQGIYIKYALSGFIPSVLFAAASIVMFWLNI